MERRRTTHIPEKSRPDTHALSVSHAVCESETGSCVVCLLTRFVLDAVTKCTEWKDAEKEMDSMRFTVTWIPSFSVFYILSCIGSVRFVSMFHLSIEYKCQTTNLWLQIQLHSEMSIYFARNQSEIVCDFCPALPVWAMRAECLWKWSCQ